MPNIFDALAGAGQGAKGAQEFFARDQRLQAGRLALEKARADMAEEATVRERERGYRAAMSEAVGVIGKMQDSQPKVDPLAGVHTPWGAAVGAGRTMAEIQKWLRGKDDATARALDNLRGIAQRVAGEDPQAAMMILQEGGNQIKQRVLQQASGDFIRRGGNKIKSIGQLGASGRISEQAAAQLQDQIEQAMTIAESDPTKLAQVEQILSQVDQALEADMKAQDEQNMALEELQWYTQRPSGYDRASVDYARRMIERGTKPTDAVAWLRSAATNAWTGGALSEAPERLKSQWKADAAEAARKFVTDTIKQQTGEKPEDFFSRVLALSKQLEPQFLDEVYKRNGVSGTTPPELQSLLPDWMNKAQPPPVKDNRPLLDKIIEGKTAMPPGTYGMFPSDSVFDRTQGASAQGRQAGPAVTGTEQPALEPTSAPSKSLQKLKAKPPKKRRSEGLIAYVRRVRTMVKARGGTDGDLAEILEAQGVTPEMLENPEPKGEPHSGALMPPGAKE